MSSETVLIGGVSGGIGSALAARLLKKGFRVAGFCRDVERARKLLPHAGLSLFAADATRPSEVEAVFDRVESECGPLSGYAHCVGSILLKTAHQTSDEEWAATIRINLDSAFFALRAGVKRMQKQKTGSMVFVSTGAARAGLPSHEAVAAAKAGIEGLVRSAAASYAPRGVRINAVAPGMVETPMSAHLLSGEAARKISEAMHPLGRIGNPDEIASLMEWLLVGESSWVSGETYSIDGGLAHLRQRPKA